jgi:glycosyltransferase involved in cell wall biosynthesis
VASILDLIPLDVAAHRRTGAKAQLFHRLSARADVVLTLSEHGASRIHELLGVPRERIVVAPLPVAPTLVPGVLPEGLEPRGYVVALVDMASPDPRKRAHWLSEIARQLDVPLVAVGAGTSGALEGILGLGRVNDATWAALLRDAAVFVYTSAYEGQGLPPLEAMAAGVPVVAMDNTAVREFVGNAGLLIPEGSKEMQPWAALAEACRQLLGDPARASVLGALGRQRAASFTPEVFAANVAHAVALAV